MRAANHKMYWDCRRVRSGGCSAHAIRIVVLNCEVRNLVTIFKYVHQMNSSRLNYSQAQFSICFFFFFIQSELVGQYD